MTNSHIHVIVSEDLLSRARKVAERRGQNLKAMVVEALNLYIDRYVGVTLQADKQEKENAKK